MRPPEYGKLRVDVLSAFIDGPRSIKDVREELTGRGYTVDQIRGAARNSAEDGLLVRELEDGELWYQLTEAGRARLRQNGTTHATRPPHTKPTEATPVEEAPRGESEPQMQRRITAWTPGTGTSGNSSDTLAADQIVVEEAEEIELHPPEEPIAQGITFCPAPVVSDKADHGKPSLIRLFRQFTNAFLEVAKVAEYGVQKYGREIEWQTIPNASDRYTDALLRHFLADIGGTTIDPESHCLHAAHVAWNALLCLEMQLSERSRP